MAGFRSNLTLVLIVVASASLIAAADEPTPAPPTDPQIQQAIGDLGADSFEVREAASRQLWEWGLVTEPALRRALTSRDAEIVARAKRLLERMAWGLSADASDELVRLIEQFRQSGESDRLRLIDAIAQQEDAQGVLMRLIDRAKSPKVIAKIAEKLADDFDQRLRELIGRGQLAEARRFVDRLAPHMNHEGPAAFAAAFYAGRGVAAPQHASGWVRFWLHRIAGNDDEALALAKQLGNEPVLEGLLIEREDWQALADRYPAGQIDAAGEQDQAKAAVSIALRAATCHRLAGNPPLAERARRRLVAMAGRDDGEGSPVLAALMMLDVPFDELVGEMLPKLGAEHDRRAWAAIEDDYESQRKAIETRIESAGDGAAQQRLHLAQLEQYFGHHEKTEQLLKAIIDDDLAEPIIALNAALLLAEDYDLDAGVAALKRIEAGMGDGGSGRYVSTGGVSTSERSAWHRLLTRHNVPLHEAVVLVRDLTTGKADRATHDKWIEAAQADALERGSSVYSISATVLRRDGRDAAEQFIRAHHRHRSQLAGYTDRDRAQDRSDLARWLAAQGDPYRAAELQGQVVQLTPANTYQGLRLAEYLLEADRPDAARRTLDELEPLLLADGAMWRRAIAVWQRLDPHHAEALRERLARLTSPAMHGLRASQDAQRPGRDRRVAAWQAWAGAENVGEGAYRRAVRHFAEARTALAAGRIDEAIAAGKAASRFAGRDIDVVIDLVAMFDRAEQPKAADAVFEFAFELYGERADRHPHSTTINNQVAWMAARCRRGLDRAIVMSKRGVAAEPDRSSAVDTLAELYFQAGRTDEAIKQMQRCLELVPNSSYFNRQLVRFKAGDPMAKLYE